MKRSLLLALPLGGAFLLGAALVWPDPPPSLNAAPEQGALRHQLAQRLEQGEADAETSLLARYQVFLAAEGRLTVPTAPDLASLQQLFDQREQLRQQSFTPAEQDQRSEERRVGKEGGTRWSRYR